jgi:PKD repeat protein
VSATVETYYTSGTSDGYTTRTGVNQTFYALRDGAGTNKDATSAAAGATLTSAALTDTYTGITRLHYLFNSSLLPDGAIIDGAVLSVYRVTPLTSLGDLNYSVTGVTPGTAGVVNTGDYQLVANTRFSTDVKATSNSWSNFTLNSDGLAAISKTGWSNFSIRMANDIDNSTTGITWVSPTTIYSRMSTNLSEAAANKPSLIITYHLSTDAPTSDFTATPLTGFAPLSVQFNDTSIASPTTWSWAYKNATVGWTVFSTSKNATYSFPKGTYDINLTATNANGSDDEIKLAYITSTGTEPNIYPMQFLNNTYILPNSDTNLPPLGSTLSINATPGEYEPASFVMKAIVPATDFQVTSTILSDGAGHTIPSSATDIKTVKVWYQAAYNSEGYATIGYYLTPELLLNNDNIVRVNLTTQKNYVWVYNASFPAGFYHPVDNTSKSNWSADYKIYDEKTGGEMYPFTVPLNENKQIWLTTLVPPEQVAGNYTGTIWVNSSSTVATPITYNVRVLPITLDSSSMDYGIYYMATLTDTAAANGVYSSAYKVADQYRVELEDMEKHGFEYPILYQDNNSFMDTAMATRANTGMPKDKIYIQPNQYTTNTVIFTDNSSANITKAGQYTVWIKNITTTYGYGTNYIYTADEPTNTAMNVEIPILTAIQGNGSKTMTADSLAADKSPYYVLGSLLDLLVYSAAPGYNATDLALWHGIGKEVTVYNYPQVSAEMPETYRNHYGLPAWAAGYDGATPFSYQTTYPAGNPALPTQNMWNDFDGTGSNENRDFIFSYSTTGGVVNTLQAEGFREAVDDTRYADTLSNITGNTTEATGIINDGISAGDDMSEIRTHLIDHILAYGSETAPTANFTCTPLTGVSLNGVAVSISCTDTSTGGPITWAYYNNTTLVNSTQNGTFTLGAGLHDIKLHASNGVGDDWLNRTGYITITSTNTPVAAFSALPLVGTTATTITFTDASTNTPTSWNWAYKNSTGTWTNFSTDQNPTGTFGVASLYSINLTATNAAGSDDEVKVDYIDISAAPVPTTTPAADAYTGATGWIFGVIALVFLIPVIFLAATAITTMRTGNLDPMVVAGILTGVLILIAVFGFMIIMAGSMGA